MLNTPTLKGIVIAVAFAAHGVLLAATPALAQDLDSEALLQRVQTLERENAELRERLGKPQRPLDEPAAKPSAGFGDLFAGEGASDDEQDALLQDLLGDFSDFETDQAGQTPDYSSEEYRYLDLGVNEDYAKSERLRLKDQILTFIPPLYQPAFLGHAYVLPPGAFRVSQQLSLLQVDSNDFRKNGKADFVHENHTVRNRTLDLDFFYGLDNDMTLRLNVPYRVLRSRGSVHPNGVPFLDAFVEGDADGIGDVSLFLKKKWWDQGNFGFNFASVVGVQFPTGSNDEKFDFPVSVRNNNAGAIVLADGDGVFRRFSDDGRMPTTLQPGTGGWGGHVGAFATRQFNRFPSALHVGSLATFLETSDGITAGNRVKFFGTYVKPVYGDYLSLEGGINGMWKEDDQYQGLFLPPGATGPVPRPSFQGGTVVFFSPSIIFSPSPQLRFTASASLRLNDPDLGPWPGEIFRFGMTTTF